MVAMAAARIFLATEQHSPLMQGGCQEVMDASLMPGALTHCCVIEFSDYHCATLIAARIIRSASQRVSRPLVRKRACR